MRAQWGIGADVHMAFDCPVGYGTKEVDFETARVAMERTHRWGERCLTEHKKLAEEIPDQVRNDVKGRDYQALYGVVQGGDFEEMRRESAEFYAGREFDGFGIGGMYEAEKGRRFLEIVNGVLPEGKPRHWLGMGAEPVDLFVGAEMGIDTFDCVAPTRQARNGALYTRDGRINISNARFREDFGAIDEGCGCWTCRNHTRAYLAHLFRAGEILASTLASIHNEYFVVNLCGEIRESILRGDFEEFRDEFLGRYYGEEA